MTLQDPRRLAAIAFVCAAVILPQIAVTADKAFERDARAYTRKVRY
jgi:hypothetical protein